MRGLREALERHARVGLIVVCVQAQPPRTSLRGKANGGKKARDSKFEAASGEDPAPHLTTPYLVVRNVDTVWMGKKGSSPSDSRGKSGRGGHGHGHGHRGRGQGGSSRLARFDADADDLGRPESAIDGLAGLSLEDERIADDTDSDSGRNLETKTKIEVPVAMWVCTLLFCVYDGVGEANWVLYTIYDIRYAYAMAGFRPL